MNRGFIAYILLIVVASVVVIGGALRLAYVDQRNTNSEQEVENTSSLNPVDTLIAINADKQFKQARDVQRRADLLGITNAVYQFASENDGNLPGGELFPTSPTCIGTEPPCFNLGNSVVPTYMAGIPVDPSEGSDKNTGYTIYRNVEGRVVATAKGELEPEITITR